MEPCICPKCGVSIYWVKGPEGLLSVEVVPIRSGLYHLQGEAATPSGPVHERHRNNCRPVARVFDDEY